MALGINTSRRNLDDPEIDWINFNIWQADWPVLSAPEFAGRYFLGGRFAQPDPVSHEIECVFNWSCGEIYTSPLASGDMQFVVPIQAGIQARQELTKKQGRLAGRIDARRFCERIMAAIAIGDFIIPDPRSVYVFLEVEGNTAITKYYWQSWAAEIMSFNIKDSSGNIVLPFVPCILCDFNFDAVEGKYFPAEGVQNCLSEFLIRDGKSYKQCHAFWARTTDVITVPPDTPEITSDIFGDFSQQFDENDTIVPVFFWQFSSADESDDTLAGLNLSVSNDTIIVGDCSLHHAGWDAELDPPTISGIDTATPTIVTPAITSPPIAATTDQVACIQTSVISFTDLDTGIDSEANGRKSSFVARYYKQNENVRGKRRLSAAEMKALTAAGLNIISVFQANDRTVGSTTFSLGWGPAGADYFSNGFNFGFEDGLAGCEIAAGLHPFCPDIDQPDRTVIYFATDYDPSWPFEQPAPVSPSVVEQRMLDLEDYFKGVAAGLIQFQQDRIDSVGHARYYDIGVYAVNDVCDRLYKLGIISHFWQLRYRPKPDNYKHANLIQTDLNDPVLCGLEVDLNIAWGAEASWNSKTEFIKP